MMGEVSTFLTSFYRKILGPGNDRDSDRGRAGFCHRVLDAILQGCSTLGPRQEIIIPSRLSLDPSKASRRGLQRQHLRALQASRYLARARDDDLLPQPLSSSYLVPVQE